MKLKKKLIIWIVTVVTIAILTVGGIINFWTQHLFQDYVDQHFQYRFQQFQDIFTSYYQQNQSWEGVDALFIFPQSRPMMMGRMARFSQQQQAPAFFGILAPGERIRLADVTGKILVDSHSGFDQNQDRISQESLKFASHVVVEEKVVGYILWETVELANVQSLEKRFVDSLYMTTLVAVMVIGIGAMLLAGRIAARLAAPLEELTRVTTGYAEDGVLQPVKAVGTSSLEAEQLTGAFNQMVEQINQNEKLRRQLMADVAHELRTPLTVLRCNLEAFATGISMPTDENLAELELEVERLVGLVQELQELSLLEQKRLTINLVEENLINLVQRAMDFFRVEADQRQISLNLVGPAIATARVDSGRLQQIMVNLLVNAFRYVVGGGKILVKITDATEIGFWQVTVEDDGQGIPPEDLPYVFDRFYKSDKARTRTTFANKNAGAVDGDNLGLSRQEGSGLGLAIVKGLIEAHGGKITAANKETGGAIFTFSIPKVKTEK